MASVGLSGTEDKIWLMYLLNVPESCLQGLCFRYTASAAVQILLFGIVAMEVKRRAPKAHTVVELVRRRWGHTANFVISLHLYLNYACILFLNFEIHV